MSVSVVLGNLYHLYIYMCFIRFLSKIWCFQLTIASWCFFLFNPSEKYARQDWIHLPQFSG